MGVFGAGLFGDDDALDVREDYRWFLADEQSDEKATDALVRQYGADWADPGAHTAVWLALAWTQWKMGRLDPRVKAAALRILDDGLDLKKWEGSPEIKKRVKALAKVRETIEAPPGPARAMPKRLAVQLAGWDFGEVVGVRLPEGYLVLLHMTVYRRSTRFGVKAPVVSILNWTGREFPSEEALGGLSYINWRRIQCGNHLYNLASRPALAQEKFERPGLKKPVTRDEAASAYGGLQKGQELEELLREVMRPYWKNPELPPHHPGFGKPGAELF